MRLARHSNTALLEHPTFRRARDEIEAVGFTLSERPCAASRPYAIVGGRSNSRWWLVPLENRRVTVSGLALFQPILSSARALKGAAMAASSLGLSSVWARQRIHVAGGSWFSELFRGRDLHFAFFTGTDSPHRKAAVQVMDGAGRILGFAKIAADPAVRPLLVNEARTLQRLRMLELQTALVPSVLFSGEVGGAGVLLTDSRKNAHTRTATALSGAHIAFLKELAARTATEDGARGDWLGARLRHEYEVLAPRLPSAWRRRFEAGIRLVTDQRGGWGPRTLGHGDFTPSNTFFADGGLYVFDWEYASADHSPGYDLLHFLLSAPAARREPVTVALGRARTRLRELIEGADKSRADALLVGYLCGHALRFAAREAPPDRAVATWDGERESAAFLDGIVSGKN